MVGMFVVAADFLHVRPPGEVLGQEFHAQVYGALCGTVQFDLHPGRTVGEVVAGEDCRDPRRASLLQVDVAEDAEAAAGVVADRQVAEDRPPAVGFISLFGGADVGEQRPIGHRLAVGAAGDDPHRQRVVAIQFAGHVEAERLVVNAVRAERLAVQPDLGLPIDAVEAEPLPAARWRRHGVKRRSIPADRVGSGLGVLPDGDLVRIWRVSSPSRVR